MSSFHTDRSPSLPVDERIRVLYVVEEGQDTTVSFLISAVLSAQLGDRYKVESASIGRNPDDSLVDEKLLNYLREFDICFDDEFSLCSVHDLELKNFTCIVCADMSLADRIRELLGKNSNRLVTNEELKKVSIPPKHATGEDFMKCLGNLKETLRDVAHSIAPEIRHRALRFAPRTKALDETGVVTST